jgi:hypothetical protein
VVCLAQDFLSLDRGITDSVVSEYGYLTQFPLAAHAMVMGYTLPELSASDPSLVPSPPIFILFILFN